MSDLERGLVLIRRIGKVIDQDSDIALVLRALLDKYGPHLVPQIPAYELERLVKSMGIDVKTTWKKLIDFLCFDIELFSLEFRLIDELDNEHYISYEELQHILAGRHLVIDTRTYSATAAKGQIFPFLVPTKKWKWLVIGYKKVVNA